MSGAADKARFHLEQSVPELREWERRDIFSKDEITSIARKRSDFEHTIATRGASSPSTYARYIAYELNLSTLACKRVVRRRLKSTSSHSSQKRMFSILDRGTRKHHGSLELWMQYLSYCRTQGARKRLQRVLTECVRMFPTKPEVWIWAARYEMDIKGDVGAARGWMQRGLRFCPRRTELWIEYGRLEMEFVAKIAARRRILGLGKAEADPTMELDSGHLDVDDDEEMDADEIALPAVSAEEFETQDGGERKRGSGLDQVALEKLSKSPALNGAIPKAIFDASMKQFAPASPSTASRTDGAWRIIDQTAADFFHMFAEFAAPASAPCAGMLLQHVLDNTPVSQDVERGVQMASCMCRHPVAIVEFDAPDFPSALRESLKRIKQARTLDMEKEQKQNLDLALSSWLTPMLEENRLAPELKLVLKTTLAILDHGESNASQ
ncbi:hypothetical protein FH972_026205 [Carpinus fangiana]|uniref:U3 small nucleolar RNA-associated protein 6 N-terminal domain-containing protein n=1 Tax=Carpinus fangiana TaxID=176857 RepID=A0A5N6L4A1_9ROSI|nr:hypothetical protein FH972_026205 [Carpinus fangiana]